MTTVPKGGAPTLPPEEWKYLSVLKKQPDGSWRYAYDMYSSNAK